MYLEGYGVAKDSAKAKEWWEKAAMQGNADAQFRLGYLYATGEDTAKDLAKAREWLEKSAAQKNQNAIDTLNMLDNGKKL